MVEYKTSRARLKLLKTIVESGREGPISEEDIFERFHSDNIRMNLAYLAESGFVEKLSGSYVATPNGENLYSQMYP